MSPIVQTLFKIAYTLRASAMTSGHRLPFLDKLVFGKLKSEVGGNIRYFVSGGAYLSNEVCEFMQTCFAPVLQGYGTDYQLLISPLD